MIILLSRRGNDITNKKNFGNPLIFLQTCRFFIAFLPKADFFAMIFALVD